MSVIPRSRGYADVRVYRGGYPTRQGVAIYADLLPAVLAALGTALGTIAEGRIAPPEPEAPPTAVIWRE